MRFAIVALCLAAISLATPLPVRRDFNGAKGAFDSIAGSADDKALVANANNFFANLNGVADEKEINRAIKQVSDQISTNNRDHVPTKQTAAWVSSVLAHFVADPPETDDDDDE